MTTKEPTTEQTFESLFHDHYASICKRIYRIVRDTGLAEDLGQQVFIKYWKKDLLGTDGHNPGAYLYRMAINEAISHLRKNSIRFDPLDQAAADVPAPRQEPVNHEVSHLHLKLWQAVEQLPKKCQLIFRLSKSEGLTYSEIADYLDVSEKTVENQMGRAFKYLREELRHLSPIAFILLGLYH